MTAIEILRAASRSVPNEDYVQFMAAVDAVAEVVDGATQLIEFDDCDCPCDPACVYCRVRAGLANVGDAA